MSITGDSSEAVELTVTEQKMVIVQNILFSITELFYMLCRSL